jgi:hypothetical protein
MRKVVGMLYSEQWVTTSCIAAAVARCCIEDCRVNNFTFQGFPAVEVEDEMYELGIPKGNFRVTLRSKDRHSVRVIDREVLFKAAKLHNIKGSTYSRELFKLIQPMITELECFKHE